ncbi:MAG: hypothetical protein QM714_02840 [Nocardioides sp.]|uniref:hypothetical protein n=1 Tax=Nocardioides sp. TaxID=35761 RepID=UPI0039E6C5DF
MNIDDRIIDLYDAYVRGSDDAEVKTSEAKAAIREDVLAMVTGSDRDPQRETDLLMSQVIGNARSARSRSIKRNLEHFLDGFEEGDDYADPLMDMAFPVGDERGIDKTLRRWTTDDFGDLVVTRYRVAAESTAAAAQLDGTVSRVLDRMRADAAGTFGDVAWEQR